MNAGPVLARRCFLGLSVAATAVALSGAGVAGEARSPVVVELFTSQGCSSCPPADALLGELAQRSGVIALSLNVDYWDYLGWRDTLGSPEHTKRQRDYAARRGDGQVYTPQMVINGRRHVVGSRREQVYDVIGEEVGRDPDTTVAMSMAEHGNELVIDIAGAPTDRLRQDSTVWLLMLQPQVDVVIERGENAGRTITYSNAVRKLMPAGMWHGDAVKLVLPKADLMGDAGVACAAVLQVGGTGPIIGATWMPAGGS